MEKAGAGTRLVSYIIDAIILWIIGAIVGLIFMALGVGYVAASIIVGILISLGYFTYFFGTTGQTPGKQVMKIKVIAVDGSPLTYNKGFMRWIGYYASYITLGIGFLWILKDENRQAFEDKVAKTYVVKA